MSEQQQIKPAILLIATRKYKQFIPELVRQIDRFFLPDQQIAVVIFSDEQVIPRTTARVDIVWTKIEELTWPYATLYRYKIFSRISEYLKKFTHLLYMDVDMSIEKNITADEIFGDGLTVTRHPGFYGLGGWGSQNVNPESRAYIPREVWENNGLNYVAGGTQGGESNAFLVMCKELAENIAEDEAKKIIAEHNDESHLQWYLWKHPEIERKELTPQFCMVQQEYLRKNWKIDHLPVSIIALDKDHKSIRS